jgi:hypothetical protein
MITDTDIFLDISPIDLWRCGDETSPLLHKIRIKGKPPLFRVDMKVKEVEKAGKKIILVGPNQGGISVFDKINPILKRGIWWKIPKGTPIPPEIYIRKDRKHADRDITHYTLCPRQEMDIERFKTALRIFGSAAHSVIAASEVLR